MSTNLNGRALAVTCLLNNNYLSVGQLYASQEFLKNVRQHRQVANTVELQWLERLWYHENMLETGVVRANEC